MSTQGVPISYTNKSIRVLVADRNPMASELLAESLSRDPRFEIAGVAEAREVLSLAPLRKSDVVLISVELDGSNKKGLQVARTLHARCPDIRIVILLEAGKRDLVAASFRCGATGVFCRSEPLSELWACIERVSEGIIWAGRDHSEFLLQALRSIPSCEGIETAGLNLLSSRELQVAECAAQGQGNKQIADHLGLSEHTIKNYLVRIFEKLEVSSRFELLFLLFKASSGQTAGLSGGGIDEGYPIEAYFRAAEKGSVAAQFVIGLAHMEGYCVEKNDQSAYYWLRVASESSAAFQERSIPLIGQLKVRMDQADIHSLESKVKSALRGTELLIAKHPKHLIRRDANSPTLRVAV